MPCSVLGGRNSVLERGDDGVREQFGLAGHPGPQRIFLSTGKEGDRDRRRRRDHRDRCRHHGTQVTKLPLGQLLREQ
jgi:hypothetical protein